LAIDVCEDVPPWQEKEVNELLELCRGEGAQAKLSSIHVNTWFGDYDKASGLQFLLEKRADLPQWGNWLFIGDSPNDEPLFHAFEMSVAVANINSYLKTLKTPPKFICDAESGAGFVEMVDALEKR
jgi:hypothetical protein